MERDYGKGSGLTPEEQESAFPGGLIPGRESDDMLEERVVRGLDGILGAQRGRRVILVTHGAVINTLLRVVSGGTLDPGETRIRNTCITILEHDGEQWHIRVHNSVDYPGALALCPAPPGHPPAVKGFSTLVARNDGKEKQEKTQIEER